MVDPENGLMLLVGLQAGHDSLLRSRASRTRSAEVDVLDERDAHEVLEPFTGTKSSY